LKKYKNNYLWREKMKSLKTVMLCVLVLSACVVLGAQTMPDWQWARQAGGIGTDRGEATAVDAQGNQYVTGYFEGNIVIGPDVLYCDRDLDVFICKIDPSGNILWAVDSDGGDEVWGTDIAVDNAGNIYVTGGFKGSNVRFGYTPYLTSYRYEMFVCKLDPNGLFMWSKQAWGNTHDESFGIAVDDAGNSYVTGIFEGSVNFEGITLTSSGYRDIFISKLDANGNYLWAKRAGGMLDDDGQAIDVDAVGNSYVTGRFSMSADFGTITLASGGAADIFVCKLDPDGNYLWAKKAGGANNDIGADITLDGAGNCYVTGWFWSTASFGSTSLTSSGGRDIFVCKLNSIGNFRWAKQAGGTADDGGSGIALDNFGNQFVTGYFAGTASFGSTSLTSGGSTDIFACKLDPAGTFIWAKRAGGASEVVGNGIGVDSAGNQFVTGYFAGTAGFDSTSFSSHGSYDIFFARLTALNAPVPKAPENLRIRVSGLNKVLEWDPVTEDINGQTMTPDAYYIYYSSNCVDWVYMGSTTNASYVHFQGQWGADKLFYKVFAIKN
jgi:hypothetical protein